MPIKWDKESVIKRFQEAITPEQAETRPGLNALQNLLERAKLKIKGKPGEVEQRYE